MQYIAKTGRRIRAGKCTVFSCPLEGEVYCLSLDTAGTVAAEKHITADFPPSFVWHTVDDNSVPVENSLLLISALRSAGVPFEGHLFAHGEHGISTCTQEVETPNPECAQWVPLSKTWLNNRFAFTP